MRYHSRTARPVIVAVDSEDFLHDDHFALSIVMNNWWPFRTHAHLYRCSCQPVNDRKSAGGQIIRRSTEQNPVDERCFFITARSHFLGFSSHCVPHQTMS